MNRTSIFRTNRSQAVRLPKDVAFPESVSEVVIVREGAGRFIVPTGALWDDFFDSPGVDIVERVQPSLQAREAL